MIIHTSWLLLPVSTFMHGKSIEGCQWINAGLALSSYDLHTLLLLTCDMVVVPSKRLD